MSINRWKTLNLKIYKMNKKKGNHYHKLKKKLKIKF